MLYGTISFCIFNDEFKNRSMKNYKFRSDTNFKVFYI